jgi:hypothetical protein
MVIMFHRRSGQEHEVEVVRRDGSTDRAVLPSKDYLRHDLAHFALELELCLRDGVWGSVARGGSLAGEGLDGADVALAERAAGRLQTLMRTGADVDAHEELLRLTMPDRADRELAERLHERVRRLVGRWNATPYGGSMTLEWPEPDAPAPRKR